MELIRGERKQYAFEIDGEKHVMKSASVMQVEKFRQSIEKKKKSELMVAVDILVDCGLSGELLMTLDSPTISQLVEIAIGGQKKS